MKMKIKTKLISGLLPLIIVPMIVLGGMSYWMADNSLQKSTNQELKTAVSKISESVDSITSTSKKCLKVASDNSDLSAVAKSDANKNKIKAYEYIKEFSNQTDGIFEWIYVTDINGKDLVDNFTKSPDKDLSDRVYVQQALNNKEGQSNTILKSKVSGKPIIGIAYPLKIKGKVVGTIGATILFEKLTKDIPKVKIAKTGYAYMIDKTGMIVYHPKKRKILKENLSKTKIKELKAIINKTKKNKTGDGYYTYEGIYKYARFESADIWTVVVTAPYDEYMSASINIRNYTLIIVFIFILIAILDSIFIAHKVVSPIKKLEKLMKKAGDGDITVEANINTGDELEELGTSFNVMIKHQGDIVKRVRNGSKELVASSETLAEVSQQISAGTEEINASIEEVATNSETQNSSILNVSQVLVQLSSLVQIAQSKGLAADKNSIHTMETANHGRIKVNETVEAINVIERATNETNNVIDVLNQLSKKVGGIITTINSIAEQTNLLALNAAIEAARAGEAGKGFTVVSDEIRKLSEQSNSGANEISGLVNEMIKHTEKAVISMCDAKKAVENGVGISKETDKSFIDVINAVEEIVKDIREIVDVTGDEVATSDQIVSLIDSVASAVEVNSEMSQQVASAAEEQCASVEMLAATAEETSAMAVSLENLVEKFKIKE
jgi:methyl-accepting chemotaxis protein